MEVRDGITNRDIRVRYTHTHTYIYMYIQVSQEECVKLRESVPYVKLYRYFKTPISKVEQLRR